MLHTSDLMQRLEQYKPIAIERYGVTALGLFGSAARGEQKEDSDVDICYSGSVPTLLTLDRMQHELEQLLGSPVDLVRIRPGMNALLGERIRKEAIYV